jgi:hypothetical protein
MEWFADQIIIGTRNTASSLEIHLLISILAQWGCLFQILVSCTALLTVNVE